MTLDLDDLRKLPLEAICIVEMPVHERVNRSDGANGMGYGWECSLCQTQTGLKWDLRRVAEEDLDTHMKTEHPTACICGRDFAKPFGLHVHQRTCKKALGR